MKIVVLAIAVAMSTILAQSCGDNNKMKSDNGNDKMIVEQTTEKSETPSPVKEVVRHYLDIKNAFAADNTSEAAFGANAMLKSVDAVDQRKFTDDQKKKYTDLSLDLKKEAEGIVTNAGKIDQQRAHFVPMSQNVQDLIKEFGTPQTLYLDHCPMANNHKGANWISEVEEIKNPYMGEKMPECGTMEEVIK